MGIGWMGEVLAATIRTRCERSVVEAGGDSRKRYAAKKMTRRANETATLAAVSRDLRRLRTALRRTNRNRFIEAENRNSKIETRNRKSKLESTWVHQRLL
jgi:hypothetical protein